MTVEEKQLAASGAAQPLEARIAPAAVALVGMAAVEPGRAPQPFAAKWFRAWEAQLHKKAVRKTQRRQWDLCRFGGASGAEAAKANYREAQSAVAQAARQALGAAEANTGKRSSRERLALVYSDFWGQCSHLEQAHNWRDSFDLDVIPKQLLRDLGIDGFSCKVQAGRSAFPQGLRIAAELLHGGEIDTVLLGGIFRFYPALGFSEAIDNAEQERGWLGKGGRHNAPVVERAGFVVLKRPQATGAAAGIRLSLPRYLQLPKGREPAATALAAGWSALLPEGRALIYGGLYPSSLLAELESQATAVLGDLGLYENTCRRFGDSGGINPLLALQRYAARKAAGDTSPALLSLSDSLGGTWLLRCD